MTKEEVLRKYPFLSGYVGFEIEPDEVVSFGEWLDKEEKEALASYGENEEVIYCLKCNQPLLKGSFAYLEGFHFDSCI